MVIELSISISLIAKWSLKTSINYSFEIISLLSASANFFNLLSYSSRSILAKDILYSNAVIIPNSEGSSIFGNEYPFTLILVSSYLILAYSICGAYLIFASSNFAFAFILVLAYFSLEYSLTLWYLSEILTFADSTYSLE